MSTMLNKITLVLQLLCFISFAKNVKSVPPSPSTENVLQDDVNTLKYITKSLAIQLEKWNNLFITNLEPRFASTSTVLASIDSNVNNLQERAHVWDTFQLHVSAWNDQLSSLDRKIDIISKGQEKIMTLENKINAITNIEEKVENLSKSVEKIQENLLQLKEVGATEKNYQNHDTLFSEFAARGILSTIKQVERKLDRLLIGQRNGMIKVVKSSDEKPKFKCNIPKSLEEIIDDVSSKVDVIFDKIGNKDEREENEVDQYVDDGSGSGEIPQEYISHHNYDNNLIKKVVKKLNKPCKRLNETIDEVLMTTLRLENSLKLLGNNSLEFLLDVKNVCLKQSKEIVEYNKQFDAIFDGHFKEQRSYIDSMFQKYFENIKNSCFKQIIAKAPVIEISTKAPRINERQTSFENVSEEPNTQTCEDLDDDQKSGVYKFANSSDAYNRRFCLIRADGIWTVIQKRDYFTEPENFNVSWKHYKKGFGNLHYDFWFGNDYIHALTYKKNLTLRIELEDFDGNTAWAEYSTFEVLSERDNYQLSIGGYAGNATDSFSSHNRSLFSTFDRKNDQAPECCSCADSYGGGWWFNSCFDSNLNGIYFKMPITNTYFKGIIWEHWLGNYSLKKSLMMVRARKGTTQKVEQETQFPDYEDP